MLPAVLVEVVGQSRGEQGFAGEVRARQESALSFQVPGLAPTGYRIYAFYP